MLVLRHQEHHFYGVQHGTLFVNWNAQPGPAMCVWLDSVHRQVGLPELNATHYDPVSLAAVAEAEEAAIL